MAKEIISTDKAPKAIGPYSQGIKQNGFIFVSGQLPVHPETNEMPQDIREQTKQSLKNIEAILDKADVSMEDVVKVTIFLKDLSHFSAVNEEYANFFAKDYPARCCVEVARLPRDAGIEIEAIAMR